MTTKTSTRPPSIGDFIYRLKADNARNAKNLLGVPVRRCGCCRQWLPLAGGTRVGKHFVCAGCAPHRRARLAEAGAGVAS